VSAAPVPAPIERASEAVLRASPRLRLIPYDQLDERDRRALGSLTEDREFFGLLVPAPGSALPIKSVSRDAALLFLTLREPARVPSLLASLFGAAAHERVCELVLDGVFELEHDGRYWSGAAALPLLGGAGAGPVRPSHRAARLTDDALEHVAALEGLNAGELAGRLYAFNRAPLTVPRLRRFADDERTIAWLTVGAHGAATDAGRRLSARWTREVTQEAWLLWRTADEAPRHDFKLYVSPIVDQLPAAFRIAVDAFAATGCTRFKLGRGAPGLCRPDKLVAYYATLEQLQEAAERILASAAGLPAQGVPFTAAIDPEGLVSWGMDPPQLSQVLAWQQHQSWRQWLCERAAVFIIAARESGGSSVPEVVRRRAALEGVDPATWSPNLAIWRGRAGADEEVA
jgi:hypothetical protein